MYQNYIYYPSINTWNNKRVSKAHLENEFPPLAGLTLGSGAGASSPSTGLALAIRLCSSGASASGWADSWLPGGISVSSSWLSLHSGKLEGRGKPPLLYWGGTAVESSPPDTSLWRAEIEAWISLQLLPVYVWLLYVKQVGWIWKVDERVGTKQALDTVVLTYLDLPSGKLKHMQRRMQISPRHTPTMILLRGSWTWRPRSREAKRSGVCVDDVCEFCVCVVVGWCFWCYLVCLACYSIHYLWVFHSGLGSYHSRL